jgi:hypothetical protein
VTPTPTSSSPVNAKVDELRPVAGSALSGETPPPPSDDVGAVGNTATEVVVVAPATVVDASATVVVVVGPAAVVVLAGSVVVVAGLVVVVVPGAGARRRCATD